MRNLLPGASTRRGLQRREPAAGRGHGGVPLLAAGRVALAFGVVDVVRQSRGTGEIVVRCDEPAEFEVGISPGRGGAEGRRMAGPGEARLSYALFADPGHAIPWGAG